MNQNHSVTLMIHALRGDQTQHEPARVKIWDRYESTLLALVHKQLSARVRQRVEADDVAQDAYASFCRRFSNGQFVIDDRDDLLKLLTTITRNKAISAARGETAKRCDVRREQGQAIESDSAPNPLDRIPDPGAASPAESLMFIDEIEWLLAQLHSKPVFKKILSMKISGLSNRQISEKVGLSDRTVQRKLHLLYAKLLNHDLTIIEDP